MKRVISPLAALLLLFYASASFAQISISSLPFAATTNFDAYNPGSSGNLSSTIPSGWTASSGLTAAYNGRGTGTGSTGGYYGFGTGTDYSLRALRSGSTGDITYAISFTNNSGSTISSITLSWTYEQWRFANTSGWNVSGTGQLAANTTLDSKDFTGSASGTNGTASSSSVASFTLNGLSIANGQTFGIQWATTDQTGADNGISIDNFSISANTVALPVSLASFDVSRNGSNDVLKWSTAKGSTARTFGIERSADGKDFKTIASVSHAYSRNALNEFSYSIPAATTSRSFYRLAIEDQSGEATYSKTIALMNGQVVEATRLIISPVPAKDVLCVTGISLGALWRITDSRGCIVKTGVLDDGSLSIGELPPGCYVLQCGEARPVSFIRQ